MNQQAEIMLTPCSIKKNGYEPKILSLEQRLAADVMIASFQSGNLKIMSQPFLDCGQQRFSTDSIFCGGNHDEKLKNHEK